MFLKRKEKEKKQKMESNKKCMCCQRNEEECKLIERSEEKDQESEIKDKVYYKYKLESRKCIGKAINKMIWTFTDENIVILCKVCLEMEIKVHY